jgi:hypothetical protein
MSSEAATARPSVVKSFVRQYRNAILAEWRLVARELPIARELSSVSLVDHIPDLLDEVADIADEVAADGDVRGTVQTARYHALDRLAQGFDVTLVVTELSMLRGAAMAVWSREVVDGKIAELRALNLAIDRAMAISVGQFEQRLREAVTGKDRALAKLESLLAASTAGPLLSTIVRLRGAAAARSS